jgi:hypothetical protein
MDLQNFHDGHFDGIHLEPDKTTQIFLRAANNERFILVLTGVQALRLSEVKAGNIILDLVIRTAREATPTDVEELYDLEENAEKTNKLLESIHGKKLQILELNPSYGASGLFLFENFEIKVANERAAATSAQSVKAKV